MNLCLFINSHYPPYPHGGVGSFAVDLTEGMVKKGHRATCISLYSPELLKTTAPMTQVINGVKVIRVPKPYTQFPVRLRMVLEKFYYTRYISLLHRQEPFDIIEGEDGLGMLSLGKLPDVPKVVRLHATAIYNDYVLRRKPSRLNHLFEKQWINRADHIVAVSDYVGKTTLQLTGLDSKKYYVVIHYAVDAEFFKPDAAVTPEPGLIVFTGVIAPRKGVKELVQAMNIVFSKNDHAHLLIVGDDKYPYHGTPFSEEILGILDQKFLNRLKFTGPQPRSSLPALIEKAELCCFPSHVETLGIGIVEAMAMGKAVIFMKTGPGPEVVEDQVSGLLCDTVDPADIAEKIMSLLNNSDMAIFMGKNARQRVLVKFEKQAWIEKNLKFYQSCIVAYKGNQ